MGQILAKYFFKLYCQKIFAVSFKSYVQLVPLFYSHPFHSLLELQLILVKILLLLRWLLTRTQISNKSCCFFIGQVAMGDHTLSTTRGQGTLQFRRDYRGLPQPHAWPEIVFLVLHVYTFLWFTVGLRGTSPPKNCSYFISCQSWTDLRRSRWVCSSPAASALRGGAVSQAIAHLMLEQACLIRDMG